MVPARYVFLDVLPKLPGGKTDRLALTDPRSDRPELENSLVAPRTPIEEELAGTWAKILGLDEVGVYDNFLELGGDSLLASQVISRVIKTFQVEVPLRCLFEAPTVAEMALVIVQNQAKEARQENLKRMLVELETLSDEQVQRLLSDEDESSKASGR